MLKVCFLILQVSNFRVNVLRETRKTDFAKQSKVNRYDRFTLEVQHLKSP